MKISAVRLKPTVDLRQSLKEFVAFHNIRAGFILSAVGSLQQANLRFADRSDGQLLIEKFEIVSLVGTLATTGFHLHISLADSQGKTIGGHLLDGCLIYTTAEIIIGESEELIFNRTLDSDTGYHELEIKKRIG